MDNCTYLEIPRSFGTEYTVKKTYRNPIWKTEESTKRRESRADPYAYDAPSFQNGFQQGIFYSVGGDSEGANRNSSKAHCLLACVLYV